MSLHPNSGKSHSFSDIIVSDERKRFFANLDVYTTVLSRLTNGRAICVDDIKGYNE